MAGNSNPTRGQEYNQDYEDERQDSFYYGSGHPHPNQVPKSDYLFPNNTSAFRDLGIDEPSQVADVAMPDFTHSDYYVAPAGACNNGWQNYGLSPAGTAGTSMANVNTPGATTDAGHSSYVLVPMPSQSRTYSEHSNRTSFHDSEGPVYSVPGDPGDQVPWTSGSEFAVDTEAMERDAVEEEAQSSMPHDPKGVLAGLYSSGTLILPSSIDGVPDYYRTENSIQPLPDGKQLGAHCIPGIHVELPHICISLDILHVFCPNADCT
jgi:hypothetical protein